MKELTKEQRLSPMYYMYDEFIVLRQAGFLETSSYKFPKVSCGRKTVIYFQLRDEM